MYARASLVEDVDSLVGEAPVRDVSCSQFHTGSESRFRVGHIVVLLVSVLDVVEDGESLLFSSLLHNDLLESTLQSPVLLYARAVLVERRCPYALYLSASESRLHHVGRIHLSGLVAGTHEVVYLVDEDNDARVGLELRNDVLHAFLKLSPVFGASHHARHVEADDTLALQHSSHLSLHYAHGQSFHDGALAHARLAYEHRVVLLSAREYLSQSLYLLLSAHDGV